MQYLRLLIEQYYDMQNYRISMANRLRAAKEASTEEEYAVLEVHYKEFEQLEKSIKRDITRAVNAHPMWKAYLKDVKGIGSIFAGALLSTIDIEKADHASSVWKYCGLAVNPETGEGDKRVRGEKISWNPFLKKTCFLIGKSFVKTKGTYRGVYDTSKAFYQVKFPEEVKIPKTKIKKYTKGHIDAMARRRTVKLFLAEFWAEWRALNDLPVSEPFAHRIIK